MSQLNAVLHRPCHVGKLFKVSKFRPGSRFSTSLGEPTGHVTSRSSTSVLLLLGPGWGHPRDIHACVISRGKQIINKQMCVLGASGVLLQLTLAQGDGTD
jgi:hypothetical protein